MAGATVSVALIAQLRQQVIPAVPVPYRDEHAIDTDAQRTYVRWMAHQGVPGVAVWAHTGRGLLLTEERRGDVLTAWRRDAPELLIVCGVGVPHDVELPTQARARTDAAIAATVRLAEAAKRGGAAAVMIHPPTALRELEGLDDRIVALHRAVADVGLPTIAFYLYDAAGGVGYPDTVLERLLGLDRVIGIKVATLDSVVTFQRVASVVQRFPDALLITGEDRFLGYSLMLGAHAALVGIAAVCTDVIAALLAAWYRRDLDRFVALSAQIDRFGAATFAAPVEGYPQRLLQVLVDRKSVV